MLTLMPVEETQECLFVCLFVQFRSHTKVCLVLDCDLIVARGKEGEGREGERERVCVCLYGGMYVCVAARLRVALRETDYAATVCAATAYAATAYAAVRARVPARRATKGFRLGHLQTILSASPGLPAGT